MFYYIILYSIILHYITLYYTIFFLRLTIPDMDKPELQRWYPVSFVMCMTWLALFAYGVVAACDGIHEARHAILYVFVNLHKTIIL